MVRYGHVVSDGRYRPGLAIEGLECATDCRGLNMLRLSGDAPDLRPSTLRASARDAARGRSARRRRRRRREQDEADRE